MKLPGRSFDQSVDGLVGGQVIGWGAIYQIVRWAGGMFNTTDSQSVDWWEVRSLSGEPFIR